MLGAALLCAGAVAQAQEVVIGSAQNPPGVKWEAIRTPQFEIIYPRELAADAQRVANTLEQVYGPVSKSLGITPRPISVILQNQGTISNGFVALAPRRAEWYNTPPQGGGTLGANSWYDLLAIHEYRHVVQFERSKRGFTGLMDAIFGEPGWLLMANFSLPNWFWEGDAVGTETALSRSGRGRQPDFDMDLRALAEGRARAPYWRAFWRSYDVYEPNHYVLGYALTTHVKRLYGPAAWDSVVVRTAAKSFWPWAFSDALRAVTGKDANAIYNEAMDSVTAAWRRQVAGLRFTAVAPLHPARSTEWTSTQFPQYTDDGRLVAFKTGMDRLYGFVLLDSAHSGMVPQVDVLDAAARVPADSLGHALLTPGPYDFTVPHSVAGHSLAWAEVQFDLRWGERSWSVVKVHDLRTHVTRTLTSHTRLFAPALSPDGLRIAAVEYTTGNRCAIVVLDALTGAEVGRLANPANDFIQLPRWAPDGRHLVYARVVRGAGRAIAWIDAATGERRDVVPLTDDNLQSPVTDGRRVFYSSPLSGVDNIYATDIASARTWQVTSRPVAALNPALSPDGRALAFNDMTAWGLLAVTMPLDSAQWTPVEQVERRSLGFAESLAAQEGGRVAFDSIPSRQFAAAPYSPLAHSLDFYGLTLNVSPYSSVKSLALASRDKLGTTAAVLGVRYNSAEAKAGLFAGVSYAGWWPIADASLTYGGRASTFRRLVGAVVTTQAYQWTETDATLGVHLPFNLTHSLYQTQFTLGASVAARRTTDQTVNFTVASGDRLVRAGTFLPVTYYASLGRGYQTLRDVQPVWGQYAIVSYQHTPVASSSGQGSLFAARGLLYFPGIERHHGLLIEGGYERQQAVNYFFSSQMNFPRGYEAVSYDEFRKLAVNYAFPMWYPDRHLLGSLQVQRVRGNLFHDYGLGTYLPSAAFPAQVPFSESYNSTGVEVLADTWLWQLQAPIGIGFRTVFMHETRKLRTSLLLEVRF